MRSTAIGFTEQNGLEKIVDGVPIGAIIPYAGSTAPFGTLICNGAAISRAAYPELFEAIGTTWGAGDGSSTFNIPDLRGYFLRGVGGNSAGLAAEQGDAIRDIEGDFAIRSAGYPDNTPVGWPLQLPHGAFGPSYNNTEYQVLPLQSHAVESEYRGVQVQPFAASRVVPTAVENRPINKAVNYIIVYE